ncbi:MAG: hypothetical protein PHH08_01270 [Candidatus ainarchaeum sp.]|nr:hypothetical protein [Candidatus ainarchaeum sp.]
MANTLRNAKARLLIGLRKKSRRGWLINRVKRIKLKKSREFVVFGSELARSEKDREVNQWISEIIAGRRQFKTKLGASFPVLWCGLIAPDAARHFLNIRELPDMIAAAGYALVPTAWGLFLYYGRRSAALKKKAAIKGLSRWIATTNSHPLIMEARNKKPPYNSWFVTRNGQIVFSDKNTSWLRRAIPRE